MCFLVVVGHCLAVIDCKEASSQLIQKGDLAVTLLLSLCVPGRHPGPVQAVLLRHWKLEDILADPREATAGLIEDDVFTDTGHGSVATLRRDNT